MFCLIFEMDIGFKKKKQPINDIWVDAFNSVALSIILPSIFTEMINF